MLDLFGLGNIGTTIALVLGAIAALWGVRWSGAKDANAKRDAQDAADYISERKRQDEVDVGHGASDGERIKRLHEIANRKRTGKN